MPTLVESTIDSSKTQTIPGDGTLTLGSSPLIVRDKKGLYHVIVSEGTSIYYYNSQDGGATWENRYNVGTRDINVAAALFVDDSDAIHVLWTLSSRVKHRIYTGTWSDTANISETSIYRFAACVDLDSNIYVAYFRGTDIVINKYNGSTWTEYSQAHGSSNLDYTCVVAKKVSGANEIEVFARQGLGASATKLFHMKFSGTTFTNYGTIFTSARGPLTPISATYLHSTSGSDKLYVGFSDTVLGFEMQRIVMRRTNYGSWSTDYIDSSPIHMTTPYPNNYIYFSEDENVHMLTSGLDGNALVQYAVYSGSWTTNTFTSLGFRDTAAAQGLPGQTPDTDYTFIWQSGSHVEFYGYSDFPTPVGGTVFLENGKQYIAEKIGGLGSINDFKYLHLGSNGNGPIGMDTELGSEFTDSGLTPALGTITTESANQMKVAHTFTATGAKNIKEIGLFNTDSTMISRRTFRGVDVASGDKIMITYKINIT